MARMDRHCNTKPTAAGRAEKQNLMLLVFLILFLGTTLSANSEEKPNHLEPIPVFYHFPLLDDWQERVYETLITDRRPMIWMTVMPAFREEYAVILREIIVEEISDTTYELEYAQATSQISSLVDSLARNLVSDTGQSIEVKRETVAFPSVLAREVQSVWSKVVKASRYPEEKRPGRDGVTYWFYAHYGYFGETWSPESGVAKAMVACGELLIKYVKSHDETRGFVVIEIRELVARLTDEFD